MQRITKYPLLIRQVCDITPGLICTSKTFNSTRKIIQHTDIAQDRTEIERSLHIAEAVLNNINETIRDQEGQERLKNISQDLWVGQG